MAINKKLTVSRGATINGPVTFIGSLCILSAPITFRMGLITGLTFIISGLFLFLSIKGNIFDLERKQVKPYFVFLFIKVGQWKNLSDFEGLQIKYKKEDIRLNSRGRHSDIHSNNYIVILKSKGQHKDIIIKLLNNKESAERYKKELFELINE